MGLWNWIKSWFVGESWESRNRCIYEFFDGKKRVKRDPVLLYQNLMDIWPELRVDIIVSEQPIKGCIEAREAVVRKIKGIFGVESLDNDGLTITELRNLLDDFIIWCDRVKKNLRPFATCSKRPEVGSTEPSVENQTPGSSSDSGFASDAPSTANPEPSPMVAA